MSGQGCNLHRAYTSANASAATSTTRNCSILPCWWCHLNVPRWRSRPNGSGSGSSRPPAPKTSRTSPHKVRLPLRPTWTPQMTTASVWRWKPLWHIGTDFGQEASSPAGRIVRASTCIWLGYVCTQILQMDNPHSLPVISNYGGGWHHQDNSGHQNAVLTGITLADGREWKETHCIYISGAKSWLLCVLASLPTSRPALRDVQIEQWSINQSLRALTTYTAFLHAGYILELGTGMPFSSGV